MLSCSKWDCEVDYTKLCSIIMLIVLRRYIDAYPMWWGHSFEVSILSSPCYSHVLCCLKPMRDCWDQRFGWSITIRPAEYVWYEIYLNVKAAIESGNDAQRSCDGLMFWLEDEDSLSGWDVMWDKFDSDCNQGDVMSWWQSWNVYSYRMFWMGNEDSTHGEDVRSEMFAIHVCLRFRMWRSQWWNHGWGEMSSSD